MPEPDIRDFAAASDEPCLKCGRRDGLARTYVPLYDENDDVSGRETGKKYGYATIANAVRSFHGVDPSLTGILVQRCECGYEIITTTADEKIGRTEQQNNFDRILRKNIADRSTAEQVTVRDAIEARRWRKMLWVLGCEPEIRGIATRVLHRVTDDYKEMDIRKLVDAIDDGKELS